MDIFRSHSDIGETDWDIHLTFREAQRAGFQFRYKRHRTGEKSVIITSIHMKSERLIIPAFIDGHPVREIADECRFLVKCRNDAGTFVLILPDTMTRVGEKAFGIDFSYCPFCIPHLTEVYFPKGSIEIGKNAFRNQWELKKLHFGEYTDIGEGAFAECRELESVRLRGCRLSKGCFKDCEKLGSVTWKNVRCTEDRIFEGTPFEKKHDLLIVDKVLQRCRKKTIWYVVPDGIEVIGKEAFENNRYILKVTLPPSVREIGYRAFAECKNLRHMDLSNVKMIHQYAFDSCKSLDPDTKIGADTRFERFPFRDTPLDQSCTNDGIVINKTLVGGEPVFSSNVWQIAEGVRRISDVGHDIKWCDIPGMTVVFPESAEEINSLVCFSFAKRLIFKNPGIRISDPCNGWDHLYKDITLTFVSGGVYSDIPVLFPKRAFGNPANQKTEDFYIRLLRKGFDITDYDNGVFDLGLSVDMLVEISCKRAAGGYMLSEECRKRYEDYLRQHMRRAFLYARDDEKLTGFLNNLSGR